MQAAAIDATDKQCSHALCEETGAAIIEAATPPHGAGKQMQKYADSSNVHNKAFAAWDAAVTWRHVCRRHDVASTEVSVMTMVRLMEAPPALPAANPDSTPLCPRISHANERCIAAGAAQVPDLPAYSRRPRANSIQSSNWSVMLLFG
jgi:hypothetical protein